MHELEVLRARLTEDRLRRHCRRRWTRWRGERGGSVAGRNRDSRCCSGFLRFLCKMRFRSTGIGRSSILDHERLFCHTPRYVIAHPTSSQRRGGLSLNNVAARCRVDYPFLVALLRLTADHTHSELLSSLSRGSGVHRHVRRCSGSMFAEASSYTCFPPFPRLLSPDTVFVSTSHQKVVLEIDFSGSLWVRARKSRLLGRVC